MTPKFHKSSKTSSADKQESQSAANSAFQKSEAGKSAFQLVNNRPESTTQRKLQSMVKTSDLRKNEGIIQNSSNGVVQRVNKVTVKNTTDDYCSGWVQCETRSTGVDSGPQQEAQDVAAIAGGSWVGGHMVNDRLGGTGGFENIVPITSSMNNRHHPVENAAQEKVGDGSGPYEVKYYMKILHRDDYTFLPSKDQVFNLPDKFLQYFEWRTKEVPAGGTNSRPRPYKAPGPISMVVGKTLDLK